MLPGPALVTIKSAEFMYDGIEGVYPVTRTSPLEPCRPSRFFFASALLPQITVTLARPLRLEMHALAAKRWSKVAKEEVFIELEIVADLAAATLRAKVSARGAEIPLTRFLSEE